MQSFLIARVPISTIYYISVCTLCVRLFIISDSLGAGWPSATLPSCYTGAIFKNSVIFPWWVRQHFRSYNKPTVEGLSFFTFIKDATRKKNVLAVPKASLKLAGSFAITVAHHPLPHTGTFVNGLELAFKHPFRQRARLATNLFVCKFIYLHYCSLSGLMKVIDTVWCMEWVCCHWCWIIKGCTQQQTKGDAMMASGQKPIW